MVSLFSMMATRNTDYITSGLSVGLTKRTLLQKIREQIWKNVILFWA